MFLKIRLCLLTFLPVFATAQRMDPLLMENDAPATSAALIRYENDLFTGTDRYYTQGLQLEFSRPAVLPEKYRNGRRLLMGGWALGQEVYTPIRIDTSIIQVGDRPYATILELKRSFVLYDTTSRFRLGFSLSAGMIGPAAGGELLQKGIHLLTGDQQPLGWQHQISNAPLFQAHLHLSRQVLHVNNLFRASIEVNIKGGTVYANAAASAAIQMGWLPPAAGTVVRKKVYIYLSLEPAVYGIAYNALLEGTPWKSSPYTISHHDVNRILWAYNSGLVVRYQRWLARASYAYLGAEFTNGRNHRWGGLTIGRNF